MGLFGIGGVVGDVLGIGADIVTGGAFSNSQDVRDTNAQNAAEAHKNRMFQQDMSSTAYRRAMSDMKEAGLNPMLAYQTGGASTPAGSMSTMQSPESGKIGAGLASTAKDAILLASQVGLQTAQTDNTKVDSYKRTEESAAIEFENKRRQMELPAVQAEAKARVAEAAVASKEAGFNLKDAEVNRYIRLIDRGGQAAGSAVSAINPLAGAVRTAKGFFNSSAKGASKAPPITPKGIGEAVSKGLGKSRYR